MDHLIKPHGGRLIPTLMRDEALKIEKEKASRLNQVRMSSRETSDLIMIGIGAFSPLQGFMNREDWRLVCEELKISDGTFWPIPVTLSVSEQKASEFKEGREIALVDDESGVLVGSMTVEEKYKIDKQYECKNIFKTDDPQHPGVAKVMAQGEVNLSGPVKVFDELEYPKRFRNLYARPEETREIFAKKGWRTIAALQLRNPMHRSHEYLAKIALEICDGIFIHQLVGKLKEGDIPAEVRVQCIDILVENYFPAERVVNKAYPMEMRYAGPREALLHACFRQNYGATHIIIGRDHAGVGNYYGPYDAQEIFSEIPKDALEIKMLPIDISFYCHKCEGMASLKTCPHPQQDRLLISGTKVRELLSRGERPPRQFTRPEVADILIKHYASGKMK